MHRENYGQSVAGQRQTAAAPGLGASPALEEERSAWGAGAGSSLGKGSREPPSAAAGSPGGPQSGPSRAPVSQVLTGARVVLPLGKRGLRKEGVKGATWKGGQGPLLCSSICEVGRLWGSEGTI